MANEPDFNIYDDLDDALMEPLEKDVEKSRAEAVAKGAAEKELQGLLERKDEEIKRLKELNQQLQTNMSTLLLTIKSELSRKDHQLANERREKDSLIFRKNKASRPPTSEKSTQTDEMLQESALIKSNDRFRRHSPDRNKGKELHRYRDKSPSRQLKDEKSSSNISNDRKSSSHDRTKPPSTDRSRDAKRSEHPKDKSENRLRSPLSRKHSRSPSSKKRSKSPRSRKRSRSPSSKYQKGCDKSDSDKRRKYDDSTQQKSRDTKKEPDLRELILKKKALENQLNKDPCAESKRKTKSSESAKTDSTDVVSVKSNDSDVEVVEGETTMIKADKIIAHENPEKAITVKKSQSIGFAALSEVNEKAAATSAEEKSADNFVQPIVIKELSQANVDVILVKSDVVKDKIEIIKENKLKDKNQEKTKSISKSKKKSPQEEDSAKLHDKTIELKIEKSDDKVKTGRVEEKIIPPVETVNEKISSVVPIEFSKTQKSDAKKNVPMPKQKFKIKPAVLSHSMTKTTPIESSHVQVVEKTSHEVRMEPKKNYLKDLKRDSAVSEIKSSKPSQPEIKASPLESSSISKQLVTVLSQSEKQLLQGVQKSLEIKPVSITDKNVELSDGKVFPGSAVAIQSNGMEVISEIIETSSEVIETPSPSAAVKDSLESSCASKENSLNQSQLSEKSDKKRSSYSKDVNEDGIVVFTINRANKKKKKHKKKS